MRAVLKSVAVVVLATILLFLVVEGASSVSVSAYLLSRPSGVMAAERLHTEYDTLLGWTHRAGAHLPDLYGKGIGLRTNAQRLRADREYAAAVPPGKTRIVCSGDSFALGHSVSDEQAWCALLERNDPRIETVNMGQAGYGIDQAYLWYRRDGARLEHDVHLFTFIESDFERVRSDRFLGFPKPYLRLVGGELRVENVPVPTDRDDLARRQRIQRAVQSLRTVEVLREVAKRLGAEGSAEVPKVLDLEEAKAVLARVFEELQRLNAERGSTLVLVFLPHPLDSSNRSADPWRELVRREAARLGIPYIDLVAEYRKIPALEGEEMFLKPFQPSHYNARGNEWVARLLHERLMEIPAVRAKFGGGE
jgi:hypothetical protein